MTIEINNSNFSDLKDIILFCSKFLSTDSDINAKIKNIVSQDFLNIYNKSTIFINNVNNNDCLDDYRNFIDEHNLNSFSGATLTDEVIITIISNYFYKNLLKYKIKYSNLIQNSVLKFQSQSQSIDDTLVINNIDSNTKNKFNSTFSMEDSTSASEMRKVHCPETTDTVDQDSMTGSDPLSSVSVTNKVQHAQPDSSSQAASMTQSQFDRPLAASSGLVVPETKPSLRESGQFDSADPVTLENKSDQLAAVPQALGGPFLPVGQIQADTGTMGDLPAAGPPALGEASFPVTQSDTGTMGDQPAAGPQALGEPSFPVGQNQSDTRTKGDQPAAGPQALGELSFPVGQTQSDTGTMGDQPAAGPQALGEPSLPVVQTLPENGSLGDQPGAWPQARGEPSLPVGQTMPGNGPLGDQLGAGPQDSGNKSIQGGQPDPRTDPIEDQPASGPQASGGGQSIQVGHPDPSTDPIGDQPVAGPQIASEQFLPVVDQNVAETAPLGDRQLVFESGIPGPNVVLADFDINRKNQIVNLENDEKFNIDTPVIYLDALCFPQNNSQKLYTKDINEIFKTFDDIFVQRLGDNIDLTYKFPNHFFILKSIPNKFLKDILMLDINANKHDLFLNGVTTRDYDGNIIFRLKINDMAEFYEIAKTMYIPPDPKTLWKDLKVDDFEGYEYLDEAYDHIDLKDIEKTLIVASCRGRSHAHVGKPRDDNYRFACNLESGWNICAVADGAGSGRFSRKGSDLACATAIDTCKALFEKEDLAPQISADIKRLYDFRANVSSHPSNRSSEEELKFRNELILDKLFHRMVYDTYNKIHDEYKLKKQEPKYDKLELSAYHSTLLFLAFKKFDFGYFFGSYWIGDGAMLIYNVEGKGQVEILGVPDSGDYAGQTRFLTMISEIEAEKIKKRTRFTFARSFESIIMATDGITDAFFPSEESTLSGENWIEFWTKTLREGEYACPVLFDPSVAPGEQAKALRGWLDFWSKGNHDDRTILLIK